MMALFRLQITGASLLAVLAVGPAATKTQDGEGGCCAS